MKQHAETMLPKFWDLAFQIVKAYGEEDSPDRWGVKAMRDCEQAAREILKDALVEILSPEELQEIKERIVTNEAEATLFEQLVLEFNGGKRP